MFQKQRSCPVIVRTGIARYPLRPDALPSHRVSACGCSAAGDKCEEFLRAASAHGSCKVAEQAGCAPAQKRALRSGRRAAAPAAADHIGNQRCKARHCTPISQGSVSVTVRSLRASERMPGGWI